MSYTGKQAYHGSVAAQYDEDRVNEPLWALEQNYVSQWAARQPAGTVVLDVPVGTGRFLPFYFQCGLRVHGVDISADMIAEARRRHPELDGRCDLTVGDAERLLLPDGSVDCVLCWRLAHLLPGEVLRRVLHEFRRVVRREIVLEVLTYKPAAPPRHFWNPLKNLLRPAWRQIRPRRKSTPWSHIGNFDHSEEELRGILADAGLAVRAHAVVGDTAGRPAVVFHLALI